MVPVCELDGGLRLDWIVSNDDLQKVVRVRQVSISQLHINSLVVPQDFLCGTSITRVPRWGCNPAYVLVESLEGCG
jgi:hypothetical protein